MLRLWNSFVKACTALVLGLAVASLHARGEPPSYDAFSDRDGYIRDEHVVAAQAMVRDPEQLESLFADAMKGNARAARVFRELESRYFPDIGREIAERTSSPECLVPVYRELSGQCIPNWAGLDFLRNDSEAGRRLRKAVADAYAARARERGVKHQAILSAISALLAATVARSAIVQAERAAVPLTPLGPARSPPLAEPLRPSLRFTQTTASPMFSPEGSFAGRSISQVADALRSGSLKASDVPVEFIVRDGAWLIVNTRSAVALRQAGIPEARWNLINRTGVADIEANITQRLLRNGLGSEGSDVLRITGSGPNASTY
jgi:hypothetical protein